MRPSFLVLIWAVAYAGLAVANPKFVPVDVPDHRYTGGWEHFVGGGLATFDCDGDLLPEIYAAGGADPAQLFRNQSKPGADLQFTTATPDSLALRGVTGAYPIDIDGDGQLDLAILRVGQDMLMKGGPDCSFTAFTGLGFESGDQWTTAFSATWEKGQTLPTLAFGTYVDRADPDGPFGTCDTSLLYRPQGESYGDPVGLEPGYCTLSMLFTRWNRSTQADLRISNDRHYYVRGGQEQLWAMEDAPRLYNAQDGWLSYQLWGMGIAARDVTGDGYSDVYLTSMGDQKFQIFDPATGGPVYRDATYAQGTSAHRPYTGGDGRPSTGWQAEFGDVNNDGRDDIFVAKGNVEQMPAAAMQDPNNLLIQSGDGTFAEVGDIAGVASMARGRGATLSDLNLDGRLDLAVVNRRAPLEIYQNVSAGGGWLLLDIVAPAPNTRAVGAFIELRTATGTQTREITVGGGHASGAAGLIHFGLGPAATADLRVIWPDGAATPWQTVSANTVVQLSP